MRRKIILILTVLSLFLFGCVCTSYADDSAVAPSLKYKTISVVHGSSKVNKLIGADGEVIWKSSNKKIAAVSSSGVIKGKKLGKCTVTAKYEGKSYKCKVKVVRAKPNFNAKIVAVKEKHGKAIIKVRFYNKSGRTLTIMSKAKYRDYTDPTYLVKQKKTAKIKGHQSKTLHFTDYGKYEIWNFAGRQDPDIFAEALESKLYYKFKFDGKTYSGRTLWYYSERTMDDEYKSVYNGNTQTLASKR